MKDLDIEIVFVICCIIVIVLLCGLLWYSFTKSTPVDDNTDNLFIGVDPDACVVCYVYYNRDGIHCIPIDQTDLERNELCQNQKHKP